MIRISDYQSRSSLQPPGIFPLESEFERLCLDEDAVFRPPPTKPPKRECKMPVVSESLLGDRLREDPPEECPRREGSGPGPGLVDGW